MAVAVVFIGVLALFALITSGLDSSAKAVADTNAALFADNVFNGLAAASLAAAERGTIGTPPSATDTYWRQFWDRMSAATTNLTIAAPMLWNPSTLEIRAVAPGRGGSQPRTVRYEMAPQHSTLAGIVNHALQYKLEITPRTTPITTPTLNNNRMMVKLSIWDGEFADTVNTEPLIFYSEFDNPGDL